MRTGKAGLRSCGGEVVVSSGGEGEVVDGGGFAGDAVVVHGVDAVGGDVHLEEAAVGVAEGVAAEVVDAFDGDAAEGEVVGELAIVDGGGEGGQVVAEPAGKDLHDWGLRS